MDDLTEAASSHYIHSTLRERILEHVFVGDSLRRLWQRGITDVEVLRSEFDAGGYDLVMSRGKIIRHIQFKSMMEGGKAARTSVNLKLLEKPSGCVIWMVVTPDLNVATYCGSETLLASPCPISTLFRSPNTARAMLKG